MRANVCKNFLDKTAPPGCLGTPDERFTMNFDSIGEPPIYWCSFCGPLATAITVAIDNAFKTRPGFAEEFKQKIEEAESVRERLSGR